MSRGTHKRLHYGRSEVLRPLFRWDTCFNLRYLTILILIILQFGQNGTRTTDDEVFDNSILFIVALHFLSCGIIC